MMDVAAFWNLIGSAHAIGRPDATEESLGELLRALSPDDCLRFAMLFDREFVRAYTWPLWGAAFLIGGGCSDDSFADFRSSLILQGREVFESAVANPDFLADINLDEDAWFHEGYSYVITAMVIEICGEAANDLRGEHPQDPTGPKWSSEESLGRLLPALNRKYGH